MTQNPISLVEAAEWTPRPAEPHQAEAWQYAQSIMTTAELEAFAALYRTSPIERPPELIQIPGAAGPQKTPHEFGFTRGDTHLIMNDLNETCTAYDYDGQQLWSVPALARGQYADNEWQVKNSDTPPGLYKLGKLYDDVALYGVATPPYSSTLQSYGWQTYDMVELENQEVDNYRAGICLHGGGTSCGWPGGARQVEVSIQQLQLG